MRRPTAQRAAARTAPEHNAPVIACCRRHGFEDLAPLEVCQNNCVAAMGAAAAMVTVAQARSYGASQWHRRSVPVAAEVAGQRCCCWDGPMLHSGVTDLRLCQGQRGAGQAIPSGRQQGVAST